MSTLSLLAKDDSDLHITLEFTQRNDRVAIYVFCFRDSYFWIFLFLESVYNPAQTRFIPELSISLARGRVASSQTEERNTHTSGVLSLERNLKANPYHLDEDAVLGAVGQTPKSCRCLVSVGWKDSRLAPQERSLEAPYPDGYFFCNDFLIILLFSLRSFLSPCLLLLYFIFPFPLAFPSVRNCQVRYW